ncbi:MAG: hypothetical protein U0637_11335 [Phycisphaerales bacterium]
MHTAVRSVAVALAFCGGFAATAVVPGTAPALADGTMPTLAPREARIRVGTRDYIVTIQLQRLLVASAGGIVAGGTDPIQATVTLRAVDDRVPDEVSSMTVQLRDGRTTNVQMSQVPTASLLPSNTQEFSGFVGRRILSDTPHASVVFRARGKQFSASFNSVQIRPVGLTQ